jgi:hypothetical protein
MQEPIVRNAQFMIPDDPRRAHIASSLSPPSEHASCRAVPGPFLPTTSKKPTIMAMEEVRRGLIKWNDPTLAPPVSEEEPQPAAE